MISWIIAGVIIVAAIFTDIIIKIVNYLENRNGRRDKHGSKIKYIASVSFGKDSLAMLLMLMKKGYRIDEVIFYDTSMEFKAIYDIRDKIVQLLKDKNIEYTELKPKVPFLTKMFDIKVQKRDGTIQYGYGLCGGRCRWGTTEKNTTISKYLKSKYGQAYKEYIGIAADEMKRIEKNRNEHKLMPLVNWRNDRKRLLGILL